MSVMLILNFSFFKSILWPVWYLPLDSSISTSSSSTATLCRSPTASESMQQAHKN